MNEYIRAILLLIGGTLSIYLIALGIYLLRMSPWEWERLTGRRK